jgi:hypothetical protein
MTEISAFGNIAPGVGGTIPLKAQLASDDSGNYVLVVALDRKRRPQATALSFGIVG